MFLEWACITVCLVLSFVVDTLKGVRAKFAFLGFKSRGISFKVSLTTPCHFSVIVYLIRVITLDTPRLMSLICESHMFLCPTIFILRNT